MKRMVESKAPSARVLILEDEGLVAQHLRETLELQGFEVVHVTDRADDAVAQAIALRPALALCDIHVRGPISGIEAARLMRIQADVPVVFVTAYADAGVLQMAADAEPYGYVVKPFNDRELLATIMVALRRHSAEARGRAMEQWLATTLSSIGDAVIATDAEGYISFVNPTAEILTGWSRAEALGRPIGEVFIISHEGIAQPLERIFERVSTTGVVFHLNRELELITRTGARLPIDDSVAPIRLADGSIDGVVVVFRDRSSLKRAEDERRRTEQRMLDAQRLESLGVLAGGIAHDFNNLLTVIMGNGSLAQDEVAADSPIAGMLGQIEKAAERGAALCAAMLAYAGKGQHQRAVLDLNRFVEESLSLLRISVSPSIKLAVELAPTLPTVEVDPSQLQQVLMNLVINAADAIGRVPGSILVRTALVTLESGHEYGASTTGVIAPGPYVLTEVADDGPGMEPEILSRIFDPFFTTKDTGRGLGLAAVRGIVMQHDGALTVESTRGTGTTFRLLLRSAGSTSAASPTEHQVLEGKGRVLVVDDDAAVRASAAMVLRRLGFIVESASTGAEAVALFTADPTSFHLLVSDLTMPGMDGAELIRRLRIESPKLPVLVMSGWSKEEASNAIGQIADLAFLRKPFSLSGMSVGVRAALSAVAGGSAR